MLNKKSSTAIIKGILTRRSPIYVQFALTKHCNLRCKMCGATDARKNEKNLTLEEINRLSYTLEKMGAGVIILTGGEPFLRQDLPEIIKTFSKRGFEVRLQTNGILITEEKIKEAINAGLKDVTISLDTLDPKKQDFICNSKGIWNKIINSLALLSKNLPQKGAMSIINTVISKMNIEEIPQVVKFASKIGFYSSLIPVHLSTTDGFIVRKEAKPFAFTQEDFPKIDKTYNKLIQMKKQGYHIHNTYKFLEGSKEFLKHRKIYWKCDSPNLYFSISPQGYFLPCVDLAGNKSMLDPDFVKVYKSKEFRNKIRQQVKACPGCMYACYPEISYLCKNPFVLAERTLQGLKISRKKRTIYSYEEMLNIAKEIRNENSTNKTKI